MAAALYNDKDTTDELWKECARWLTRWGMLREDHRANLPEACIADLANILRDGVLLCKLLNKVDPGCIDMKDVNLKPTMAQFLCLHNIELFLRTCLISFSLKEHDLFDPLVLFELTNFHKVLCTLSKLSLSSKAQEGNILGFTAHKVKTKEEEVIYQSLKSVELPSSARGMNDPIYDVASEEIYQDLCVLRTPHEVYDFLSCLTRIAFHFFFLRTASHLLWSSRSSVFRSSRRRRNAIS
jgi:guanine nucleotide exchange factor VAV